jgi:hypothetical protein
LSPGALVNCGHCFGTTSGLHCGSFSTVGTNVCAKATGFCATCLSGADVPLVFGDSLPKSVRPSRTTITTRIATTTVIPENARVLRGSNWRDLTMFRCNSWSSEAKLPVSLPTGKAISKRSAIIGDSRIEIRNHPIPFRPRELAAAATQKASTSQRNKTNITYATLRRAPRCLDFAFYDFPAFYAKQRSSSWWPLPLKLDTALFGVSSLFNSNHLPLHLAEFGGCLFVAADKERGWPEDDYGSGGS